MNNYNVIEDLILIMIPGVNLCQSVSTLSSDISCISTPVIFFGTLPTYTSPKMWGVFQMYWQPRKAAVFIALMGLNFDSATQNKAAILFVNLDLLIRQRDFQSYVKIDWHFAVAGAKKHDNLGGQNAKAPISCKSRDDAKNIYIFDRSTWIHLVLQRGAGALYALPMRLTWRTQLHHTECVDWIRSYSFLHCIVCLYGAWWNVHACNAGKAGRSLRRVKGQVLEHGENEDWTNDLC